MSYLLPDDLASWPDDPYALLGVDYYVDERTVRKAYLQLVRRFKPDFHPEHFQRIREAYDTVLAEISYGRMVDQNEGYQSTITTASEERSWRQASPSTSQCDEAWQAAIDGREKDAYSKLIRLYQRGEGIPETCLRLYWLLKASPELDASTNPCHWLVEGLCATRLTGPMRDLYAREIAAFAEESQSERCTKLLSVDAEPGRIYDFMQIRWQAIDRLRNYERITDDLKLLKDRLAYQNEILWNRLLLLAANHLAWGNEHARRHFDHIKQTLTQSRFVHHELDYELDRLDLLIEVTHRVNSLRHVVDVPVVFIELIEQSWTQPFERYEPTFEKVVAAIADDPARGMRHIDYLKRINQAAAAYLVELIRSHQRVDYHADGNVGERAKNAAKRFVYGLKKANYDTSRPVLLQTSVSEATSPELVARFADELLGSRNREAWWTAAASTDLGMQGAYYAYRFVWG